VRTGDDVIEGITRRTILELVTSDILVEYRCVKVLEMPSLDEAFFASSEN